MQTLKSLENLSFYFTIELSTQTKNKFILKFRYWTQEENQKCFPCCSFQYSLHVLFGR